MVEICCVVRDALCGKDMLCSLVIVAWDVEMLAVVDKVFEDGNLEFKVGDGSVAAQPRCKAAKSAKRRCRGSGARGANPGLAPNPLSSLRLVSRGRQDNTLLVPPNSPP